MTIIQYKSFTCDNPKCLHRWAARTIEPLSCPKCKKYFKKDSDSQPNILEFGPRSLNRQHTNRTLVIPKVALAICGYKGDGKMTANVKLFIYPDGKKVIQITPILKGDEK